MTHSATCALARAQPRVDASELDCASHSPQSMKTVLSEANRAQKVPVKRGCGNVLAEKVKLRHLLNTLSIQQMSQGIHPHLQHQQERINELPIL